MYVKRLESLNREYIHIQPQKTGGQSVDKKQNECEEAEEQ